MRFTYFPLYWTLIITAVAGEHSRLKTRDSVARICWHSIETNYLIDSCPQGSSNRTCLCQDEDFMKSLLGCVEKYGTPEGPKRVDKALKGIIKECKRADVHQHSKESLRYSMQSPSNKKSSATITSPGSITKRYNGPILVNKRAENLTEVAMANAMANHRFDEYFSSALLGALVLYMLWGMVTHFCFVAAQFVLRYFNGKTSRAIRKRFLLAPVLKKNHSQPIYWKSFSLNLPTRTQSVFLTFFCIMNVVFLCVGYHYSPEGYNDGYNGGSTSSQLLHYVAVRNGVIISFLTPFLWLFAGRNNFFLWATGWPLDTFNVLHKWVGRIIMIHLCMHSILYTADFCVNTEEPYSTFWTYPYWYWGNIALFAGLIIFVQGMHYLRCKRYDFFLALHFVLAALFLAGMWRHLTELHYVECVYATFAWWVFERLVRLVRIIWSGVGAKSKITLYPDNIIRVDIDYSKRWKFYPGCYAFIHFVQRNRFWQNHPFTFIHAPGDPSKLQVFARVKYGITQRMAQKLVDNNGELDLGVWIDGPYGSQHPVHKYDSALFFAGGIGITGTFTYAQDLVGNDKNSRFTFIWIISDLRALDWFKDHLAYLLADQRFEVQIWHSRPQQSTSSSITSVEEVVEDFQPEEKKTELTPETSNGEPSETAIERLQQYSRFSLNNGIPNIFETVAKESQGAGSLAVISCGPGAMNDDVRLAVGDCLEGSTGRVDLFEESFSW